MYYQISDKTNLDNDKKYLPNIAKSFIELGFNIYATAGTYTHLVNNDIEATKVLNKVKRLININNWNINDISNYELILNDAAFRKDNNITEELDSLICSILQAELLNVDA